MYGMVAMLLASKMEDVDTISMYEITVLAAHQKFSVKEVVKAEEEVLKALEFRVILHTLIDEVFL
jgi:hypothetical protein